MTSFNPILVDHAGFAATTLNNAVLMPLCSSVERCFVTQIVARCEGNLFNFRQNSDKIGIIYGHHVRSLNKVHWYGVFWKRRPIVQHEVVSPISDGILNSFTTKLQQIQCLVPLQCAILHSLSVQLCIYPTLRLASAFSRRFPRRTNLLLQWNSTIRPSSFRFRQIDHSGTSHEQRSTASLRIHVASLEPLILHGHLPGVLRWWVTLGVSLQCSAPTRTPSDSPHIFLSATPVFVHNIIHQHDNDNHRMYSAWTPVRHGVPTKYRMHLPPLLDI